MKRLLVLFLSCALVLQGCGVQSPKDQGTEEPSSGASLGSAESFTDLSDPALQQSVEDKVYSELIADLDSDQYFIENVEAKYVSKEYLNELSYNSQENLYFGYSLADLEAQMQGTKYVFSLGDDGQTTVKSFEAYDDTYDQVIRNVAIGGGVILVLVTVSVVSAGVGAPAAVTVVLAASAKDAAIVGGSTAVLSGAVSGIMTGVQTGDMEQSVKAAALSSSEGLMWGAITGVLTGGINEVGALYGASRNGLTMSEAATIQQKTKYPLDVIKAMGSSDEAIVYENAGLTAAKVGGRDALIRKIDWSLTDEFGRSNIDRVKNGLAPLASDGTSYELHHVGQMVDSPLAVLTAVEHRTGGNSGVLHAKEGPGVHSELTNNQWAKEKIDFWSALLAVQEAGA